jgi:hypothetical protein
MLKALRSPEASFRAITYEPILIVPAAAPLDDIAYATSFVSSPGKVTLMRM